MVALHAEREQNARSFTHARHLFVLMVLVFVSLCSAACDDKQALKARAERGDPQAQNQLSWAYYKGEGVERDDAEAVKWARLSAARGLAAAQVNLGVMYHKGEGVGRDDTEAVKWYRLAAAQGFARAQMSLGIMYHNGH